MQANEQARDRAREKRQQVIARTRLGKVNRFVGYIACRLYATRILIQ